MKRARALATCLALVVSFSIAVPTGIAYAQNDNNACDPGELCVWIDPGYQGCFSDMLPRVKIHDMAPYPWDTCKKLSLNDSITSYNNKSGAWYTFGRDPELGGFKACVGPYAVNDNLGNFAIRNYGSMDNQFSSLFGDDGRPPTEDWLRQNCQYIDRD
jgi:hypothetical protein